MDEAKLLRLRLPRAEIAYRVAGSGPPVMLIHGWAASSRYWLGAQAALGGRFTLIAPDLPGFGASPPGADPAQPAPLAGLLLELADALGLGAFAAVGHSFGAAVALHLAARAPGRVARLGLVSFGLPRSPGEGHLLTRLHLQSQLALAAWRPWLALWRPWLLAARPALALAWSTPPAPQLLAGRFLRRLPADQALLRAGVEDLLAMDARAAVESSASVGDPALGAAIAGARAPALVVAGADDPIFPIRSAEALVGALPAGRLLILEGCGHVPMVEQPALLHRALADFLGRAPTPAPQAADLSGPQ